MKEINKETIITQLKDSKLKEEEDLQLQKEEELKIQKKRLEDKEKNDAYLNDQQQQLDLQLEEQEPAVNDIDVVQEQENIVGLNRNIEEQKPLEGMANKQEVLQEMEKQEPVLIPKKELKKSIEKKINEVPELPEALSSIVKTISEWTGKLSEESSLPLVNAAKGLLKVTTNREFGFAMADLTKAALDYLNLRKGHRFTLSGRTRQKNAKTLISAIGYFLPEADEQCKKSIENELSSGYASVDYMPDKYKGFYEENNMSFYKKPSEFFDDGGRLDNNALMLNANFYFDMKYGSLQKKEKKLIDSQKTPLVDVKLSKLSAKDYAKQFGPEFKDELNSETRKQEQTEYSELYNKLNNKKLIEESAQKEKPEAEINVDDKRFLKLLDEYMKLDTGKIDLSSDEAVAKSSNRMEILTQKHKQMLELLPVHKKAFDGLTDNSKDYINRKLAALNLTTSYYRVCKMIITDELYSSRKNSELSLTPPSEYDHKKMRLTSLLHMKMTIEAQMGIVSPKQKTPEDQQKAFEQREALKNIEGLSFSTKKDSKDKINEFGIDYSEITTSGNLLNTLESTIQLEKSAYVFVSSKETKLSKNESTEINVDQAKNMLDEAIESMPPLRKMTREVATEKIDDWKKARLYWDAIKDNDAVTKEDKNKYEDYVKRFDALEDYLDKYSTLIQHPGFVKLSMEGYSLPKNGTIEPEKDYSEYSAYSKNNSEAMSKDVFEALGLMRNLTSQWSTLIGSQEDEINAVREEYFNSKEDESNKTDQQRAAEGLKKGHAYSMILEKKLTEHRLKNNVKLSFNQRVITATVSSLSVLEGISLDECKEMELNLATKCEEVLQIKDKDKKKEQLEKKAKTIEKIFDAVMKIDFNTIHLDDEKLLENAALSEIKTSFGMEVGYVLDEYLKIPKEEGINLKYDEEKIKILKARYETLTDLATAYNTKLYSKALDFGQTEEGKKLMTMDPIKFMTEKVKRGKDSSNAEWFYIQRIMNYKAMQMRNGGADPTVKGSLQESMDKYHINSID